MTGTLTIKTERIILSEKVRSGDEKEVFTLLSKMKFNINLSKGETFEAYLIFPSKMNFFNDNDNDIS